MGVIKTGEISANYINGNWWGNSIIRAERSLGDTRVKLIIPVGPRTSKTVTIMVGEEELMRLALWMRGESR